MFRYLILAVLYITITPYALAADISCNDHQCIAIVDVGSTGSRLHVYSYDLDETSSPVHVNEVWNKKIRPGFATIEPNINTIDAYLTTLFSGAPDQQIPVYFYATAGMRLLPVSRQKKYYDEVQNWFSQQSQWQLIAAKTISGNDEALYDWLSVNYHLGSLQTDQKESVGVMDMGGASVQIVFPIQKTTESNPLSQVELDLYGHHYNLYVQSFLGLGQTEVSHQFLNSASCFANNYPLPDGASGQGNASSCEQEVSMLMTEVHKVNNLIQPILAANPVDSWYSIGGISNLADSSLFHFNNNKLTNQSLLQQADSKVCHQQWDALDSQFPDDEYVYQFCLFSAYYYALMVDGYGIVANQSINYIPPDQNMDWTMGVVLHH
jgi:Golgi nucleoside diphosphatase